MTFYIFVFQGEVATFEPLTVCCQCMFMCIHTCVYNNVFCFAVQIEKAKDLECDSNVLMPFLLTFKM